MSSGAALRDLLAVAAGGACGAVARYCVGLGVMRLGGGHFPWGTMAVNVMGCFLLGLLAEVTAHTNWFSSWHERGLGVGFLGALTTFSTFGHDSVRLAEEARWGAATANVVGNLIVGLVAVVAGIALARRWTGS